MANYDIGDALSRIENILLDSMSRNLKHHIREESDLQKSWSMWQTEQLTALGNWSAKNYQQHSPVFAKMNQKAENFLKQANQNAEFDEEIKILNSGMQQAQRFFDVPDDKLQSLLKAVRSDLSKAEHSILRKADDVYREALFDAHFYLQSGTGTLNQAIDMAVSDLHQRGLQSITYKNGRRVEASVYARMALRTANERAQLLGEGKARDKYGIHTVIVPCSGIACPKCVVWMGKVLVDDVYSSGTAQEAKKLNLPLLSDAIRQGFLHPQCNCSPQTYYSGQPVLGMSQEERKEAVRRYQVTQQQRYHERQIRKWKRTESCASNPAQKKSASARKREWQKRCKNLCDTNSDFLRRDYSREKIYNAQTSPIMPNVITKPLPSESSPEIGLKKPMIQKARKNLTNIIENDTIKSEVTGKNFGEKRKQIPIPYDGYIEEEDLQKFNENALKSIIDETGYNETDAKTFQSALQDWLDGDYESFTAGHQKEKEKIINAGLSRMGAYDGEIRRGLSFKSESGYRKFSNMEISSPLNMKSVSAWSNDKNIADRYARISSHLYYSVILICEKNKSAVGIQHISRYGTDEDEILAPSTTFWKVTDKQILTKYDYFLSKLNENDLTPEEKNIYMKMLSKYEKNFKEHLVVIMKLVED